MHLTEELLSRFLSSAPPGHGPGAHPSESEFASFLRGELPRAQAAFVVRHLLTRCDSCLRVTASLWLRQSLGEPS